MIQSTAEIRYYRPWLIDCHYWLLTFSSINDECVDKFETKKPPLAINHHLRRLFLRQVATFWEQSLSINTPKDGPQGPTFNSAYQSEDAQQALLLAKRPVAIGRTLEIFNDSWSFAVLQELFFGVKRFDDFQRNLNISRSVLTRRLRHLEDEGILSRKLYSTRPKRYEYKLTERGLDMYPIFVLLRQWGEKWLDNASTSGIHLSHKSCGHDLDLVLSCKACGHKVEARDVDYEITEE